MNYSRLLLGAVLTLSFGVSAQEQPEARHIPYNSPNNSLENPASYANIDHYKAAKLKGALVYGRDYIFDGVSASDASQQLIDAVDPYSYLNQFKDYEKVYVDLPDHGLTMILFAKKTVRLYELNEND